MYLDVDNEYVGQASQGREDGAATGLLALLAVPVVRTHKGTRADILSSKERKAQNSSDRPGILVELLLVAGEGAET